MDKLSLTEEQLKIIRDIQSSIPQEWLERVTKRESIAPVTKEIMERALKDPEVDEETKIEFQLVIDSGFFDNEVDVEQSIVSELIDSYVEKEMLKAVIAKKLPKPKVKRSFEEVYKRFNKAKELYDKEYNNNKEN